MQLLFSVAQTGVDVSQVEPVEQGPIDIEMPSTARPWNEVLGRALFEIVIVAVGVLLALAVDEWREKAAQRQLADEARATLRAETIDNRDAVIRRMRRTAELFLLAQRNPERVGDYVFERRNMHLLIRESAWVMAIETGALRWLSAEERASVAGIYAGHQRMRDIVNQEMLNWAELAAFQGPSSPQIAQERDRAIRVWLALAQRAQLAQCATVGRYEQALGAKVPDVALVEFCRRQPAWKDPADMYRAWEKLGWVSESRSTVLSSPAPPPSS